MSSQSIRKILIASIVVLLLGFTIVTAYARYQESIVSDQEFVAKPLEQIAITNNSWRQEDGAYLLEFELEESQQGCRIYIATSVGVTNPELLDVSFIVPGETGHMEYKATPYLIEKKSSLYKTFGPGYVFEFVETDSEQEMIWKLEAETQYTIRITGLDDSAEQISLIRVFVETAN